MFDNLTRPAPELGQEERVEVKKVARELLDKLKQLLVLNWRQKATARSQVKLAIEDMLDQGLPRPGMSSPRVRGSSVLYLIEAGRENITLDSDVRLHD